MDLRMLYAFLVVYPMDGGPQYIEVEEIEKIAYSYFFSTNQKIQVTIFRKILRIAFFCNNLSSNKQFKKIFYFKELGKIRKLFLLSARLLT
jgi:hypothetical protein